MTLPAQIPIVDDEPQAMQVLSKALAGLGDLSFAPSGSDALDRVATNPPDLVLLDARMPGLDGFATCVALKARQPEIPILFVTLGDQAGSFRPRVS